MIHDRLGKLAGSGIPRPREIQTELAEWVEVAPRCWERKLRQW